MGHGDRELVELSWGIKPVCVAHGLVCVVEDRRKVAGIWAEARI